MSATTCPVCGSTTFVQRKILWPALITGWGLTESEAEYIERQQGVHCMGCGCNLRAMALGQALKARMGITGLTFTDAIGGWFQRSDVHINVLEVNEAGALAPILAKIPGHVRASWPDVDLRALPYEAESFDVVVHSDTLEHIPDVVVKLVQPGVRTALKECHRVLRPGGALCFTVPTLIGKLTRSTEGRPPTYHDPSPTPAASLRVHTEFGADVWAYVLDAGFKRVEFTCIEWPAGLAITAWK